MHKGYLSIVLHAHLPYVRHPEYETFLEEDWLFEAVTETYIPLINVLKNLVNEGVKFRIAISLSPPLVSMLNDKLLQERYERHLWKLIELAGKEVKRTIWDEKFHHLAIMYHEKFLNAMNVYRKCNRNLINLFRDLRNSGCVEIITSSATHSYFPLMNMNLDAMDAQIKIAIEIYKKNFGCAPVGFWLPECGYTEGIDELLKENGIDYFIVDSHGILLSSPRPKYGTFLPVRCKSGVAVFGRDMESSKQVWSAIEGYPGDYDYREFYRDVGYDLDYDYIKPYLHDGIRTNLGIKYYRITGKTDRKEPYEPDRAREKAAIHAGNFMFNREKQIEYWYSELSVKPVILAPYDAELFGHWWFEGPLWLDFLFRKIEYDQDTIKLITPKEYLELKPKLQVVTPSLSSWGYKGYNEVWLNGANDWLYRHIHKCAERMVELATIFPNADGLEKRALNQSARELLLAQSSDWAFIMKSGTAVQ
ncbi:MAG: 1,4-alpha-glucan branching protein domain-containing protein, partial [Candidatus Thermoplasmatota archaeon]